MSKDFLTDDEMSQLEGPQKDSQPDFLSDEEMTKLESGTATKPASFDLMKAGKGLLAGDAKMFDEGLGDWVPDVMVDASKGTQKGLSLGHDDEIRAAVQHPIGAAKKAVNYVTSNEVFDPKSQEVQDYIAAKQAAQRDSRESQERSPIAFGTGEFVGGMAPIAMSSTNPVTAGLVGAASAGLAAEGDSNSDSLSDDVGGIALNAGIGGALGAGGQMLGNYASKKLADKVASRGSEYARKLGLYTDDNIKTAGRDQLNRVGQNLLDDPRYSGFSKTINTTKQEIGEDLAEGTFRRAQKGLPEHKDIAELSTQMLKSNDGPPEWIMNLAGNTLGRAVVGGGSGYLAGGKEGAALGMMGGAISNRAPVQKFASFLAKKPQIAQALQEAAKRGKSALASTHFILLQKDPEYQEAVKEE